MKTTTKKTAARPAPRLTRRGVRSMLKAVSKHVDTEEFVGALDTLANAKNTAPRMTPRQQATFAEIGLTALCRAFGGREPGKTALRRAAARATRRIDRAAIARGADRLGAVLEHADRQAVDAVLARPDAEGIVRGLENLERTQVEHLVATARRSPAARAALNAAHTATTRTSARRRALA